MEIRISASPHTGQAAVHHDPARFKVLAAGRRWGKTRLGVNECLDVASRGGWAWWISPSYKMSDVGWRPLHRIGVRIGADIAKVDRRVTLPGGGWVQIRSADNPDSLRGEGLDYAVFDECAFTQEAAWMEAVRPALSDKQGGALFISTPKGHNWFWRMWLKGQDGDQGEWRSWRFPTASNPYIDQGEIDAAQQMLPERIFWQEYEAQFIPDAGGVFRNVVEAATATEQHTPTNSGRYVFGVDWGKHQDFTAISVMDTVARRQATLDRFNQIDYAFQTQRLRVLADRFQPIRIIAEANAMGEPLIEQLRREGLPVEAFVTTSASKTMAIEDLALAFERGEIAILNDPVQVGELQAYEMERLPSGSFRYNAPSGMHDDTVIALALAWQGCKRVEAAGVTVDVEPAHYQPERRRLLWH